MLLWLQLSIFCSQNLLLFHQVGAPKIYYNMKYFSYDFCCYIDTYLLIHTATYLLMSWTSLRQYWWFASCTKVPHLHQISQIAEISIKHSSYFLHWKVNKWYDIINKIILLLSAHFLNVVGGRCKKVGEIGQLIDIKSGPFFIRGWREKRPLLLPIGGNNCHKVKYTAFI